MSQPKGFERRAPIEVTDVTLANAWFHGDLIRADPSQIEASAAFEIDNRFSAAAVRTAQLAIMTRDTLSYIKCLGDDHVVHLSARVLDEIPVAVTPKALHMSGLYSAPEGTEAPGPAGQRLPDSWELGLPGTGDGQWIIRVPWGRDP